MASPFAFSYPLCRFTGSHAQLDFGFPVGRSAPSVRPEIITHPTSSSPCPPHLARRLDRHSAKRGGGSFSEGGSPLCGLTIVQRPISLFVPHYHWNYQPRWPMGYMRHFLHQHCAETRLKPGLAQHLSDMLQRKNSGKITP